MGCIDLYEFLGHVLDTAASAEILAVDQQMLYGPGWKISCAQGRKREAPRSRRPLTGRARSSSSSPSRWSMEGIMRGGARWPP